jgi:hypothetical protein
VSCVAAAADFNLIKILIVITLYDVMMVVMGG